MSANAGDVFSSPRAHDLDHEMRRDVLHAKARVFEQRPEVVSRISAQ